MAQPFDATVFRLGGEPSMLLPRIGQLGARPRPFPFLKNGSMAYTEQSTFSATMS